MTGRVLPGAYGQLVLASTPITGLTGARVLWGATTRRRIGWGDSHAALLT